MNIKILKKEEVGICKANYGKIERIREKRKEMKKKKKK
jgi:hypothetical protein